MIDKKILFVVAGHYGLGMGHTYRVLDLSNNLKHINQIILCTKNSLNSYEFLRTKIQHSNIMLQDDNKELIDYVIKIKPDLVIHDILNTEKNYIKIIRTYGINVINFEDLGSGAKYANMVINALYYHSIESNVLLGHEYFDLREEFLTCNNTETKTNIENVLVSFGGEDKYNITLRLLNILICHSALLNANINVVIGPAYKYDEEISKYLNYSNIKIFKNPINISKIMRICDFAVVSNGRTPLELAKLIIPSIVISTNNRELEHEFPNIAGFYHLGLHEIVTDKQINKTVSLISEYHNREKIKIRLAQLKIGHGKKIIMNKILDLLN
jgi:spore coat polysaccharide biosynthesis predicted glycosyltransferase SpsG